ncbi:hypothetical protein [Enterobacter intestinihominis]
MAQGWDVLRLLNNDLRANEEEMVLGILQGLQGLMPSP